MTDLLDLLADLDHARHMLMPTMGLACGLDLLATTDPWTLSSAEVTCPDCIRAAEPHGGISRWCQTMLGH